MSRLTGMNSEAISIAAHIAIELTALHIFRCELCGDAVNVDIVFLMGPRLPGRKYANG
ncbi:hypothetical protein EMIT0158MI4_270038 [Burkholderia ambifaria]